MSKVKHSWIQSVSTLLPDLYTSTLWGNSLIQISLCLDGLVSNVLCPLTLKWGKTCHTEKRWKKPQGRATEEGSISQDRQTCSRRRMYRAKQPNPNLHISLAEYLIHLEFSFWPFKAKQGLLYNHTNQLACVYELQANQTDVSLWGLFVKNK